MTPLAKKRCAVEERFARRELAGLIRIVKAIQEQ